ncbi:MAG TPA: hypothetical protein VE864_08005, partial [Streptosporangiaceae bacterium]|nr:hypothetical protein [Streptosporangiaceae bacterium]
GWHCQSCGLPLGAAPTALAVDRAGPAGRASLHHGRCRQPEWNESGAIAVDAAHQTHRSWLAIMPSMARTSRRGVIRYSR